jgi:Putative peptidoglycan binding domain
MGMTRMNSRRGIIVGATVSLFGLTSVADLRAAEDRPAGFDCTRDRNPLAVTVCNDSTLTATERRTTENYLAAYFGLSEQSRTGFRNDHIQWLNGLTARCAPSANLRQSGEPALSVECVRRLYTQRGDLYRKRLSGTALEESNLSPALLKKVQKRLADLKFLSGTVDGVFGADTRTAIKNYQASVGHAQSNFLTAQERNMLLASNGPPAQTSLPKQTPVTAAEPAPAAAPAPRSAIQDVQSADNRSREPETTGQTPEQPPQQNTQNTVDTANPPANADAAAPIDTGGDLQTQYFMAGALLAVVILAFAALLVSVRLRRRAKRAMGHDDVDTAFVIPVSVALKPDALSPGASTTGKHTGPSVLSNAHGVVTSVARDAQRVDADAPLAPERVVELHLEKGAKP